MARALESEKSVEERINFDPYAGRFAPAWLYCGYRILMRSGYIEWRAPGLYSFLIARERYIDDTLKASLASGVQQLVILGAGFDSRAYRIEGVRDRVKVFEVDHPATQENKPAKLKVIFGQVPGHVTYGAVDFNTQALEQRLREAGYGPDLKTLFIWQGVSMYLSAEEVDTTLAFVTHFSAPGSAIRVV